MRATPGPFATLDDKPPPRQERPPASERHALIIVVTTAQHRYTHSNAGLASAGVDLRVASWDEVLLTGAVLPDATYVLTDFDRLPTWRLGYASALYQRLSDRGLRVLNNPALATTRAGLLRRLHRAGINAFDAYRLEEWTTPRRWPVLFRTEGDHEAPSDELYPDKAALERGLSAAVSRGVPLAALLVVEFCAEPAAPGLWRKQSVFRVGDRYIAHPWVLDTSWVAKDGKHGIATPELHEEEFAMVRDNPWGEALQRPFELSGSEYGRADFGIVGGRPQVYEINSNPTVERIRRPHPSPVRRATFALFRNRWVEALKAIDTPPG